MFWISHLQLLGLKPDKMSHYYFHVICLYIHQSVNKLIGKYINTYLPINMYICIYMYSMYTSKCRSCVFLLLLFSHWVVSNSLWPHGLQHARLPCPLPSSRACSNLCPLSWWCHPNISSFVIPFSSCLQSFLASGSFPMSWLFMSSGQSIEASASVSVFPMNIQGCFPLGLTGLISLQSKGLSRVFFNTTVWKHQFFGDQSSLHPVLTFIHDYWKNHSFGYTDFCWQSNVSAF